MCDDDDDDDDGKAESTIFSKLFSSVVHIDCADQKYT